MPTQGVEKGYRKKESANALLERALEQARAAEAAAENRAVFMTLGGGGGGGEVGLSKF